MKRILAPSILSADFRILGEQLRITEEAGAQYIHFDVMDGMFVPSISFGMPVLSSIRGTTGQTMDVHLMVTDPIRYVEEFAKCGADSITVHQEACEDLQGTLDRIHGCGVKAGTRLGRNCCALCMTRDLPAAGLTMRRRRLKSPVCSAKAGICATRTPAWPCAYSGSTVSGRGTARRWSCCQRRRPLSLRRPFWRRWDLTRGRTSLKAWGVWPS